MKRFFHIFCLALVLLGQSRSASAQELNAWTWAQSRVLLGEDSPALRALLGRGEAPGSLATVLREAQDMQRRGLPTEPFLLKANEGWAKGVSPARMQSALGRVREETAQAGRWVDAAIVHGAAGSSPRERREAIQAYQKALAAGVSPRFLSHWSDSPGEWGQEKSLKSLKGQVRGFTNKEARKRETPASAAPSPAKESKPNRQGLELKKKSPVKIKEEKIKHNYHYKIQKVNKETSNKSLGHQNSGKGGGGPKGKKK